MKKALLIIGWIIIILSSVPTIKEFLMGGSVMEMFYRGGWAFILGIVLVSISYAVKKK